MTHHAHWRDVSPGHFASKHTDTDTKLFKQNDVTYAARKSCNTINSTHYTVDCHVL